MMGSEPGRPHLSAIGTRVSIALSDFCFFFGCGSSVDEARCFDRAGTGMVGRAVTRGGSVLAAMPGVGFMTDSGMETGLRTSTHGVEVGPSSR